MESEKKEFDPKDPKAMLYVVRGIPKPVTPWWSKLIPIVVILGFAVAWFVLKG